VTIYTLLFGDNLEIIATVYKESPRKSLRFCITSALNSLALKVKRSHFPR